MIESLKALFAKPEEKTSESTEHQLQLAAAALLVETSRADYDFDEQERRTLTVVLKAALDLQPSEIDQLIESAGKRADEATSLFEFTTLINDHYDNEQKLLLIQSMWRVAFADGNLDKYEESLIRKVAELIYVSHSDYIRMKMVAGKRHKQ